MQLSVSLSQLQELREDFTNFLGTSFVGQELNFTKEDPSALDNGKMEAAK